MKFLFWFSFGIILYTYFGYPLLLKLLAGKRKEQGEDAPDPFFEPNVSLIIPVHNEEKVIEEKIQNTLSLDYPKNKLEILIASDASIFLEEDALRNIVRNFSENLIGCVSGEDYIPGGGGEGAYGRYELVLRNLESRAGSIVGASGCFYAQRRSLCEPFPEGMAPDFYSVLETVEKGYRAVTDSTAKGMMRSVPDPKSEFQKKVRTFLRGITTLLHFKHLLNPFKYGIFSLQLISHKLMRWSTGVFLILLFLSNLFLVGSKFYLTFLLLQVAFYSLAFVGWMGLSRPKIFRIPLFFSMVNLSALIAWGKYFRGFRQEVWEPSRR